MDIKLKLHDNGNRQEYLRHTLAKIWIEKNHLSKTRRVHYNHSTVKIIKITNN